MKLCSHEHWRLILWVDEKFNSIGQGNIVNNLTNRVTEKEKSVSSIHMKNWYLATQNTLIIYIEVECATITLMSTCPLVHRNNENYSSLMMDLSIIEIIKLIFSK